MRKQRTLTMFGVFGMALAACAQSPTAASDSHSVDGGNRNLGGGYTIASGNANGPSFTAAHGFGSGHFADTTRTTAAASDLKTTAAAEDTTELNGHTVGSGN
jgi:hypothetical protein